MTPHLVPPAPPRRTHPADGPARLSRLDQLGPVETHALRLLRMWSWGAVHRETLALAAATRFGPAQGLCVVGTFESLFARLETAATPPLSLRQPDSGKLDPDELWFLDLVAAAQTHGPEALRPRAAHRVAAGAEAALADSLHGFVATLAACLARTGRPHSASCPASCPAACPMHGECTGRPPLRLVETPAG